MKRGHIVLFSFFTNTMLKTKSIVASITDVPREWVFEYYLKLGEKLKGQDIKIFSLYNPGEKVPSFFVYFSKSSGVYKFKDFSTDKQGDGTELVKELFKLSTRGEAAHRIIKDFNAFVRANPNMVVPVTQLKIEAKYKVVSFTARGWNKMDANFWLRFKIGSKILAFFNVQPLKDYTITKNLSDGTTKSLLIHNMLMYGYFRSDGTLYKIYQPFSKENKFMKVVDYIQGTDQLTFKKDYLVIGSSLKDIMVFCKLKFKNAECVAPDSENILIPEHVISGYRLKYKGICTLFDNDAAGIKSMHKYKKVYQIPYVHLDIEKDLADAAEAFGIIDTRIHVYPLLTQALTGVTKQI